MKKNIDGTFRTNLKINMHRWYPYIEGFSENFVKEILNENINNYSELTVYDPFNGSGTTTLTCSYNKIASIGSEINPLMRFISETKVNTSINIIRKGKLEKFKLVIDNFEIIDEKTLENIEIEKYINKCYINQDYFSEESLKEIAYIKKYIRNIEDEDLRDLMLLALASILVSCSNMVRASDLRRRKGNELNRVKKPINSFQEKLEEIYLDLKVEKNIIKNMEYIKIIDNNSKVKNENYSESVNLIITSPPYVNGTNYFRNTKLELWILDLIEKDTDLRKFRGQAITSGINNVSSRIDEVKKFEFVQDVINKFEIVEKNRKIDKRIPRMIEAYFSDMDKVFKNLNYILKEKGKIYFDIGDSQYYGVHIPVFDFIIKIAELNGLNYIESRKVRDRRSNSGLKLSQEIVIFEKKL